MAARDTTSIAAVNVSAVDQLIVGSEVSTNCRFWVSTEGGDKDGTILIAVDAATSTYTARYGTIVRPFQIKNPTASQPAATATVGIESLLPNPEGADEQLEEVTLRNRGTSAVPLCGWILRDRSALTWTLSSSLNPGQAPTFGVMAKR